MQPFLAFLLLVGLVVDDPATDVRNKALAELQGDWWIVGLERGGKVIEFPEGDRIRLTVKGNRVARRSPDSGEDPHWFSVKLDTRADPKLVDLTFNNGGVEGIYLVRGDTWKLCFHPAPGAVKDRPIAFRTENGSGHALFVMRRAKE